jgi:hypothetical protein
MLAVLVEGALRVAASRWAAPSPAMSWTTCL